MEYLVVAGVAGLAAVERKGFLQAMLSRPVALAPLLGWALGDLPGGLALELLWLGAVNMGAALPPNETLATAAITGGAVLAGRALGAGVTPSVAALAVALAGPLAVVGRATDRAIEDWNVRLAERAEALVRDGSLRAAMRENLRGLALPFAVAALLAPAGAALVAFVVPALLRSFPSAPPGWGFAALAGLAAAAGARAFRSARGMGLFAGAAAATFLVGWLAGGLR